MRFVYDNLDFKPSFCSEQLCSFRQFTDYVAENLTGKEDAEDFCSKRNLEEEQKLPGDGF